MELSREQKRAVETLNDRVVVAANSGAGKTRVLTERVRYLLNNGANPKNLYAITFTNLAADEMTERLGDLAKDVYVGTIHGLANQILLKNGINCEEAILREDFDYLLERVMDDEVEPPQVDNLLVDEFQDICDNEYNFMFHKLKPKSFFVVGDSCQCQPEGTNVLMSDWSVKKIEDLKVGDKIKGADPNNAVEKIHSEDYGDKLIKVTTHNGFESIYTPNHRCVANLNLRKNDYILYLCWNTNIKLAPELTLLPAFIKEDDKYYCSWKDLLLKDGDCINIISVFNNLKDGQEARKTLHNGLAQSLSTMVNDKYFDYPFLSYDTPYLKNFISYEYEFETDDSSPTFNPIEVTAEVLWRQDIGNSYSKRNFLEMVTFVEGSGIEKSGYSAIAYVPEKPVKIYSLSTTTGFYISDNIFTHNSIYSFKGSNCKIFMRLVEDPFVDVIELRSNYRSGKNIITFANRFLHGMRDVYRIPTTPKAEMNGEVISDMTFSESLAAIKDDGNYKDWFILTRTNDEISYVADYLNKYEIPFVSFKKSEKSLSEIKESLDENKVKLLTIHSAKGLESKKVIVIGTKKFNDEEERIAYVAATRAKELLIWIKSSGLCKKRRKKVTEFGTQMIEF